MGYLATGDLDPSQALHGSIAVYLHNRLKVGRSKEAAIKELLEDASGPCHNLDGDLICKTSDIDAALLLVPDLERQQKAIDGPAKRRPITFDQVLLVAGVGVLALLLLVPAPRRR